MGEFKSNLLGPGTKFQVTENSKDTVIGPYSTGFISCIRGVDSENPCVIFYDVIINRRGKSGKDRLETSTIMSPIYEYDGKIYKEMLPEEDLAGYVHIEEINENNFIEKMSNIDFLAWSNAYSSYIYKLSGRSKYINLWPEDNTNIIKEMYNARGPYQEDPIGFSDYFGKLDKRIEFIKEIRLLEAKLVKTRIDYAKKVATIEQQALKHIQQSGGDKAIIPKTIIKPAEKKIKAKIRTLDNISNIYEKAMSNR